MANLEWTSILHIGLPKIDEQHKKLIGYSNSLLQAMVAGKGKEALSDLFEDLLDYTDYHFADEVQYMTLIGYPELDEHKLAHKKIINELGHLREKLFNGDGVSPEQALDFLNDWIIKHIMGMDSRIGDFANNRS